MFTKSLIVMFLAISTMVPLSNANDVDWGGLAENAEFLSAGQWWDRNLGINAIPGDADWAVFRKPLPAYFTNTGSGVTHSVGNLYLGDWNIHGLPTPFTPTLNIGQGTLTVLGSTQIGSMDRSAISGQTLPGAINITGGSLISNQHVYIGYGEDGTLNINGNNARFVAGWSLSMGSTWYSAGLGGVATININNGELFVNQLIIDYASTAAPDAPAVSKIIIGQHGVLKSVVLANVVDGKSIADYIAAGKITAAPGYELYTETPADAAIAVRARGITIVGDFNNDKIVDDQDLAMMAQEWLVSGNY